MLQPAWDKISSRGTSFCLALETLAALVLWLVSNSVSIPDLCSTILAHLEIVSLDTDLCGLTKLINNCCSSPLIVSVPYKYCFSVFMGHMRQSCLNSWTVIVDAGFPGLLVLVWLVRLKTQEVSLRCIVTILSKCIDCPLCPVTRKSNSSLSVRSFNVSVSTGSKLAKYFRTNETSHILLYLGWGGLFSKPLS